MWKAQRNCKIVTITKACNYVEAMKNLKTKADKFNEFFAEVGRKTYEKT